MDEEQHSVIGATQWGR